MKLLIDFTQASIVITGEACRDLVAGTKGRVVVLDESGEKDSVVSLRAAYKGQSPTFYSIALHEPQAIKFTGGTTGAPKGVMQPMRAWNTNIITQIYAWELQTGDRFLASAPMTHGTSTYLLPTLGTGGALVIADRPRVAETLALMAEHGITTLFVPPTVIYMMMEEPGIGHRSFSRLRNLIYGAGPMRPDAIARAQEIFGPVIASTYGQTEAPQIATYIRGHDLQRPEKRGSVGCESPLTRVTVMAGQRILPPGETGEVVIRGDLVMTGYLNQPEKTAETITDGWLRTGDLGMIDQDGFLFIQGRVKDVIISGGFNVYPKDVESVLARHDAVYDCAVFGVPDEKWGEAVRAAVSLRTQATASEKELIAFIRETLGPVKTPKSIAFYEQLPLNAYGKLQRQKLIDDALQALQEPVQ
jgi:acyl-coenzyme A synthetase/AMP-(fatty) acid ligase